MAAPNIQMRLHMRDSNYPSGSNESRGILGNLGGFDNDPWAKSNLSPYAPAPWQQPAFRLTVISRDAPVNDKPVTLSNPFDFSQTSLGALQSAFLWNKLLFDPRLSPTNPFFSSDSNRTLRPYLFDPRPMNPWDDAPILPEQFR